MATDILARGIDIKEINLVINYDTPNDAEDYVHRIGRTARADSKGVALTFISDRNQYRFHNIETLIEQEVPKLPLPEGFEEAPEYNPTKRRGGSGGGHRRRHGGGGGRGGNNRRRNNHGRGGGGGSNKRRGPQGRNEGEKSKSGGSDGSGNNQRRKNSRNKRRNNGPGGQGGNGGNSNKGPSN